MKVDTSTVATREALHRVVVHILARARMQSADRFSLRVTPGGFGTPEMGIDGRRVRVVDTSLGATLCVEHDRRGAPAIVSLPIAGATLRSLAEAAGVDLARQLDVGADTPDTGDFDAPIVLDPEAATQTCEWFSLVGAALDRVLAGLPVTAMPTLPRVWPEHFDLAIEAEPRAGARVNLGGSPGDGFVGEPYLYVGPWGPERPGDPTFWNAPFGAVLTQSELRGFGAAHVDQAAAFLREGFDRLT